MKVIAHRGLSSRFPELTESAFRAALELPIHGIETDVRLTKCGEVVNVHDPIVDCVSNGRGRVSRLDLESLLSLNFGTKETPEKVLTLNNLLDIFEDYPDKHLYIETKHPMRYAVMLEEEITKILKYRGLTEDPRIHIISFALPAMYRMARLAPQLDRIHLRRSWERWGNPRDVRCGVPTGLGLSLERAKMDPRMIGAKGLPTYLFTVDKQKDMLWAREQGVDMLATNYPDRAAELLNAHPKPAMYANAHGKED